MNAVAFFSVTNLIGFESVTNPVGFHSVKNHQGSAKGGTRTPMAVNHRILSPARLPVPPLSRKIKLRVTRLLCYYPPREWLHTLIFSTVFSGVTPARMGNHAYRGTRPAPSRFPARPPGTSCAWRRSTPPMRRFARHAPIAARAGSSPSSGTCAWSMPARSAVSSSGSPVPETPHSD